MKKAIVVSLGLMMGGAMAHDISIPSFEEVQTNYIRSCVAMAQSRQSDADINQIQHNCECILNNMTESYGGKQSFINTVIDFEHAFYTGQVEERHNQFLQRTAEYGKQCSHLLK